MQKLVDVDATVIIAINDLNAIKRYSDGEPIGEDGKSYEPPYPELTTEEAILEHFAYNAVANGVQYANELDGWADLPADAAKFYIEIDETYAEVDDE